MTVAATIALDAMGGDHAPEMVIEGAAQAHEMFPHVRFLVFGDEGKIGPLLARYPKLARQVELRHTAEKVEAEDKPSQALRKGRGSSMRLAIDAVANGEAGGVVSAGNTGALMAMAKFVLKTLPGIDRPALCSLLPTLRGEVVMLDLGANVECDPENLVQFAIMGANYAHAVLGRQRPLVGLLNVGVETVKGNESVKAAAEILMASKGLGFDFHGFVEGNDIAAGTVDVVVTDGFTGNIALKTTEGTAKLITGYLSRALRMNWRSKLGYLLARPAFEALRSRVDPRFYNGAVFVGLNGIVVKSHGGTDAPGFCNAIGAAVDLVSDGLTERIAKDFQRVVAAMNQTPAALAEGL